MENIIQGLLAPDNNTIEQFTNELHACMEKNETLLELCNIIQSNNVLEVRQYAAVLLHRRIVKTQVYRSLTLEQNAYIKNVMWHTLILERAPKLRNIFAAVVGAIVHQENQINGSWPNEILSELFANIASANLEISENSAIVLALIADNAAETLINYLPQIASMFPAAIQNNCINVCMNMIKAMSCIVPFSVNNMQAEKIFSDILPSIMLLMPVFAANERSEKDFFEVFEIFESLAEYTPKLLNIVFKDLLQFCIFVASKEDLMYDKRVRATAFLGCLAQIKKKLLVKLGMVEPLVHTLFALMKSPTNTESQIDDFFDDDDSQTMISVTGQTLDLMALHVPEENFFPPLLQLLEPALQSGDIVDKRAAYLTMAVVAEGCSQMICNKYLPTMVAIIKAGITHTNLLVRNAAFYCLAQYAEYLQPEIAKYAHEILPVLFEFLQQICNDDKYKMSKSEGTPSYDLKQEERMFFALEVFCENIEAEQLQPFLPVLMERLLAALHPSNIANLREITMHTIAAAVKAAKENFMPYFNSTIELLRPYFVKSDQEDIVELRHHAIDCLAEMALNVGKENFMPIAKDTMAFALQLLEEADDPDDKSSIYGLLANMAEIFNEEMETVFPKVMNTIYDSIINSMEILVQDDASKPINSDEDIEIDISACEDEDEEEDDGLFDVHDSYLREKEEAICALGSFAKNCGPAFMPYLEASYQNIYKMLDHPSESVRDNAAEALTNIIIAMITLNPTEENKQALTHIVEKFDRILRSELQLEVALHFVDNYVDLLKALKGIMGANENYLKIITNIIHDILQRKLKCQFSEMGVENEDAADTEDSAYEFSLVESAGDLLPALGYALSPDRYYPVFDKFCPLLLEKLKKNKSSNDDDGLTRFFVFGVLAECFKPLDTYSANYFDLLLPNMLRHLKDKSARVRQNTVYGLGELVFYSGKKSYDSFPRILVELSEALASETKPCCLDNICGTICRLILTNHTLVPLSQVLPVLFQFLPLREDFAENTVLIHSWQHIYANDPSSLLNYYDQVVLICLQILARKQYENDAETKQNTINLLLELRNLNAEKFNAVVAQNPANAEVLNTL